MIEYKKKQPAIRIITDLQKNVDKLLWQVFEADEEGSAYLTLDILRWQIKNIEDHVDAMYATVAPKVVPHGDGHYAECVASPGDERSCDCGYDSALDNRATTV